ncbi:MAG: tRNA (guanosine(37)-N1)-methyltransferase TrmD [Planctomycetota bacterium]
MKVQVLTLFPRLFDNFLQESIVGIARDKGALQVQLTDWREYTTDRHRTVDDRPFGGGPGMVMKPEPIFAAVEDVLERSENPGMPKILFTPQGRPMDQATAEWLSGETEWMALCGRYEGFDERVHEGFDWHEVSLGPFVLSGGELAAMALIEASTRLIPGVLGDEESARQDSFTDGRLDHPHYTRPRSFRGKDVPDVLLNGNHEEISTWRRTESERRTAEWRAATS